MLKYSVPTEDEGTTRRELLTRLAAVALALPGERVGRTKAAKMPTGASARVVDPELERAYQVRLDAARQARDLGRTAHRANGDEQGPVGRLASFSKALPHDPQGRVDNKAYDVLFRALASGAPGDFENVPLGGFARLANPQAGWSLGLVGPAPVQLSCPPAPTLASAEQAGELVELYWQALLRDVPFAQYGDHPLAREAAADLSRLSDFRGPLESGAVTAETLFRGSQPGDVSGPYISQFLLKPVPYLPTIIDQKIRTVVPEVDYLLDLPEWSKIQNGALAGVNRFDPQARYLRNGRDLGEYVHRDFSYQPYLSACLMALKWGTPPDGGNPYKHSRTQSAFSTFGPPYLLALLAIVTQSALAACWYQKWRVHRRLRPEELAGRWEASRRIDGAPALPIHGDLESSSAVAEIRRAHAESSLLPQAYPEGCPIHPSYPSGHAAIAGACVTALKAVLDERHIVPEPAEAASDGTSLIPYKGRELAVGEELDKLASNISLGRGFAGIHWRSDTSAGLFLGEEVALRTLAEMKGTGNELFQSYALRRFDGRRVEV
ncbi:MAG: vanadium-dependent haloperoxidase [Acidobacteriota bacterium]